MFLLKDNTKAEISDYSYSLSFSSQLICVCFCFCFFFRSSFFLCWILGEIGGNMGLLLGCSVLTLCEFIEFLCSVVAAKLCKRTNITPVTSVQWREAIVQGLRLTVNTTNSRNDGLFLEHDYWVLGRWQVAFPLWPEAGLSNKKI